MAEPVAEEWRCERNDGKRWRCKKRRKDDDTLCEHHYAEKMAKCGRGAFTSKSRRHRGGKAAVSPNQPSDPTAEGFGPDEKDDSYPPGFGPSTSDGEVSMDKTSTEGKCMIVGPNERDPVVDSSNMVEELCLAKVRDPAVDSSNMVEELNLAKVRDPVGDSSNMVEGLCLAKMSKAAKKTTANSNLSSAVQEKNKGPENKLSQSKVGLVWCHQCHMSDKGRALSCMYCKKKQYCGRCMIRWYPHLSETEFSKKCPLCRNNCNCKACLRNGITKPAFIIKKTDVARHSYYVLHTLLPWLKELREDQMIEKEFEATIKGLEPTELKLQQVVHQKDDHVHCNNCRTSIFDFHRSCPNCSYALCLVCCRELHRGLLPRRDRTMTFGDWKVSDDGNITCPRKEVGGCGSSLLELKCMISEEDILGLEQRATTIVGDNSEEFTNISRHCSCFTACRREAAYRNGSDDNYLYCPNISDFEKGELAHFQNHWVKGEPVIVRDVLEFTSGLSWEPIVLWRAFREMKSSSKVLAVKAIDCQDWCEVEISLHNFFSGYDKGQSHANQCPQLFKLKDWPPDSSFGEGLLRHGCEFIAALPFQEYTHPRYGLLNLATKLPEGALQPNLGPKTYIAHGHAEELGNGDSVTKLHCHMYDTVNVLAHTTEVTLSADQPSNAKKLKKRHMHQDTRECQQLAETENLEGQQGTKDDDHVASGIYMDSSKKKPKMKANGSMSLIQIRSNLESSCKVKEIGVDANLACSSSECTKAPEAGGNGRKIVDYNGILKPKMKIGKLVIDCTAVELQSKERERSELSGQKDLEKQTETGRQIPDVFGNLAERKEVGGRKKYRGRKSKNSVEGNHSCTGKSENHVYDGCGVQKRSDLANSKRNHEVGQAVVSDDTTDNKQRGGALWDVFRREDVPKLQAYLTKYSRELRHVQCRPVEKVAHPIHDQCLYLTVEHKKKLKDEYGIEPWTFEQNLGEAILIPAGCPHQVRNLTSCIKIALDFVSPENVGECIRLAEEFRMLPDDHRAKEDELEVKKMAFHAIRQAVKDFEDYKDQLMFKAEVGEPSMVVDASCPLLSPQLQSSLIEAQTRNSSPIQVHCSSQLFPIEAQTHHPLSSLSLQSSPVEAQTHPSLSSQSFQPWLVEADACQPSSSQNLLSYPTEILDSVPPFLKSLQCSPMETYPSFPWRPHMAEGEEIRDEASAASGTSVSPDNHGCRLLLWKPTTPVDDPTVKGVVYERKGKATLISDKLKRNHLVAHVSSAVENGPPIKASSVSKEMILGQKEKLSRCPSLSDPPSSDNDPPLAKEENREHYRDDEDLDSKFLMVTPINEIPPESPGPPPQNVKHTTSSPVKCDNMVSKAKSGVATASPKEHDKHGTSSSRSAAFSISVCMEEMKKYNDIAVMKRVKAAKELQNKNWRETFMCMDDEMRRVWMESLE